MSCSNLCKTNTTAAEPLHTKNVDNNTSPTSCTLNHAQKAVNIMEGDAISCVFNSDSAAGKTILITNCSHNDDLKNATHAGSPIKFANNNMKNKSSITIYTHTTDSEIIPNKLQAALPPSAINILISNHFEHPGRTVTHENNSLKNEQKLNLLDEGSVTNVKTFDGPPITAATIKTELPATGNNTNKHSNNNNSKETNVDDLPIEKSARTEDDGKISKTANNDQIVNVQMDSIMTNSGEVSTGDTVFIQEQNKKLYLGTMVAIEADKCKIKYDNDKMKWTPVTDIERLISKATQVQSDGFCIICKVNEPDHKVEVCEQCGRGYHKKCVPSSDSFKCLRCEKRKQITIQGEVDVSVVPSLHLGDSSTNFELPYDINTLKWDALHRYNVQSKYCYCGKKGKWFRQMLQCARCLQWFHSNCVQSLAFPLYFGDRFYLFVCSVCNHGREFIRRLHMTIEHVVHLLLFNLTIHHTKQYFNFSNVIIPYARDNWPCLQLPVKLQNMVYNDMRDEISKALNTTPALFQSSTENSSKTKEWGLKIGAPPQAPNINLPPGPLLTEKYINDLFSDRARIYFLPQNAHTPSEPSSTDLKVFNLMYGRNYLSPTRNRTNATTSTSTTTTHNKMNSGEVSGHPTDEFKMDDSDSDDISAGHYPSSSSASKRHSKPIELGATAQEFDKSAKISNHKKRRYSSYNNKAYTEAGKFSIHYNCKDSLNVFNDSADERPGRGTLDSIIPPPRNFIGSNNPFLSDKSTTTANSLNAMRKMSYPNDKINDSGNNGNTNCSDITTAFNSNTKLLSKFDKGKVRIVRTIKRRLSAKDIFIGPNMEIKRRKVKKRSETGNIEVIRTSTIYEMSKSASYLPHYKEYKEADLKKESLVESVKSVQLQDIRKLKDGELAKIYDFGNKSIADKLALTPSSTSNPTALSTFTPNSNSSSLSPPSSSSTSSTTFNHNHNTNTSNSNSNINNNSNNTTSTNKMINGTSPIKLNGTVDKKSMKSSFNIYFGIANRIANGENFTIKGKRISIDGRLQYLIEWDGV